MLVAIALLWACAEDARAPTISESQSLGCESSAVTLEDAREGDRPDPEGARFQLIRKAARHADDEEVQETARGVLRAARGNRRKPFIEAAEEFARACRKAGWRPIRL